MIKLEENLEEIQRVKKELSRCTTKGPHYRDMARRLRKLKRERSEAMQNLRAAGKM